MPNFIWTALDQAFSSVSNILISIALARGGGAEALGVYTAVFAVYLIFLGFQRALMTDPLLTLSRFTEGKFEDERNAIGATLISTMLAVVVVCAIAYARSIPELLMLAVVLPLVCLQDLYRYLFFRRKQPARAVILDGFWVVVSIIGFGVILKQESPSIAILVWGVGGGVGLLAAVSMHRVIPARPRESSRWWWRDAQPLGKYLALESIIRNLNTQAMILILTSLLGATAVGQIRAAQILMAPAPLLQVAFSMFIVPKLAGRKEYLTTKRMTLISGFAAGLVVIGVLTLWLTAPILFPILFGSEFDGRPELIVPLGVSMAIASLCVGPQITLKLYVQGKALVFAKVPSLLLGYPIVILAALYASLSAVLWSMAFGGFVYMLTLWYLANKAIRELNE